MSKRNKGKFEPRADDHFPTPLKPVSPLIAYLRRDGKRFAEPCAGEENVLVRHLEAHGFECVHATDISRGQDALEIKHFGDADVIVTNPPHTRDILHKLIAHFMRTRKPVWLLIDYDWSLRQQSAPYLTHCTDIVPIGRVIWIDGTRRNGFDNYAWYRFDINHRGGPRLHPYGEAEVQCAAQIAWTDDCRDRAAVVVTAVLQILADVEPDLAPDELKLRLELYVRDEFADLARQIVAQREVCDA